MLLCVLVCFAVGVFHYENKELTNLNCFADTIPANESPAWWSFLCVSTCVYHTSLYISRVQKHWLTRQECNTCVTVYVCESMKEGGPVVMDMSVFSFFLPGNWSGGRERKTKDRNIKPPLNTLFLDIQALFSNINTTIIQSTPLRIARELCRAGEKKKNGKGDEESLGKWDWNERWRSENEATDEEMLRWTLKGWEGGYGGSCGCCTPQEPVTL